ncbi:hypothetical protein [Amycolatopsis sp. YIM 10]|uniref:hypothetical protein n=1 Tax=Amycolatopsis sp. YIM 10 TaxID=2653857 RepID=UPI00128FFE8D|nr:hypothetical protein [Amycolatopsis sp. YIM 10]QFU85583.1 hypothetical protein YIM_01770 [Amycolatopsis sp. YIM 10]
MWVLITIGAVFVLLMGIALVQSIRDRGRGGTRAVRLPTWSERWRDQQMLTDNTDWGYNEHRTRGERENDGK